MMRFSIGKRGLLIVFVAMALLTLSPVDEHRLGIRVADVSGHGDPASLIRSRVKIAFASNTSLAHNPAAVLSAINRVLCGKLESDSVTAG